jgi:hypothetical protein
MLIRYIYTVFIGILLALFVGAGINVFYPQPAEPKYPTQLNSMQKEPSMSELAVQNEYNRQMDAWNEKMKPYNRNVSMIALTAAVIFVAIGLLLANQMRVIADGFTLGGVFTLIYSIGRGFASGDSKYSFVLVTLGLVVSITLGYIRFIKPAHQITPTEANS